jgi:hypothetical protein
VLLLSVGSEAWEVEPGEVDDGVAGIEAIVSPPQWKELMKHGSTDSDAPATSLDESSETLRGTRSDFVAIDDPPT